MQGRLARKVKIVSIPHVLIYITNNKGYDRLILRKMALCNEFPQWKFFFQRTDDVIIYIIIIEERGIELLLDDAVLQGERNSDQH